MFYFFSAFLKLGYTPGYRQTSDQPFGKQFVHAARWRQRTYCRLKAAVRKTERLAFCTKKCFLYRKSEDRMICFLYKTITTTTTTTSSSRCSRMTCFLYKKNKSFCLPAQGRREAAATELCRLGYSAARSGDVFLLRRLLFSLI